MKTYTITWQPATSAEKFWIGVIVGALIALQVASGMLPDEPKPPTPKETHE